MESGLLSVTEIRNKRKSTEDSDEDSDKPVGPACKKAQRDVKTPEMSSKKPSAAKSSLAQAGSNGGPTPSGANFDGSGGEYKYAKYIEN